MNRIYKYSLISFVCALFCGCEIEPISEHSTLSDASWYISGANENYDPIVVPLGSHVSLMDVSQGESSHEWIVPQNQKVYFIKGPIGYGTINYDPLIQHNASYTTSEKTVHLLFRKPGEYDVRLRNCFPRPASYTYIDLDKNRVTHDAEYIDGQYVMDTVMKVRVYDPIMVPAAKVYKMDANGDKVELETGIDETTGRQYSVTIEYGDKLYFEDCSTDAPNDWAWNCAQTGTVVAGENAEMEFKKLANADNPITVDLTVKRVTDQNDAKGKFIPSAAAVTGRIPLSIIVEESSQPLVVNQPKQLSATQIEVELANAEFDPATLTKDGFSISYTNTYNGANFSGAINVESVELAAGNPTALIVNLDPATPIYNTDEITMSYSGTIGVMYNQNNFSIEATAPNVKTTYAKYLFDDFESGNCDNWELLLDNKGLITDLGTPSVIEDPNDPNNKCMFVDASLDAVNVFNIRNKTIFAGGTETYTFKMRYMVNLAKFGVGVYFNPTTVTGYMDISWAGSGWINIWGNALNTWIDYSVQLKGTTAVEEIQALLRCNAYHDKLYIDDVSFGNEEIRTAN